MWMYATIGLGLLLFILGVTSYLQTRKLEQQLKQEKLKAQELQKQVKVRGETIVKMEKNPDLINSRDFNLDYLRMRMAEEVFHYEIVNQVKNKVRDKISIALRPKQVSEGALGIASGSGRQIDEIFDVEYKTDQLGTKRTLFRIGIRLVKLPTQPTSVTIGQLIDCIETFLSPDQKNDTWQPTIQGRLANLRWDQKAKPTPLLLIEQTQEGTNVTFRTQRAPRQQV
jgi:cell division protein FtsB